MNPYHDWLNIDCQGRQPNLYELLGVEEYENDQAQLRSAFQQRFSLVRQYEVGTHHDQAVQLMEEISGAYHCLTSAAERARYDDQLRQQQQRETTVIEGELIGTKADVPSPLPQHSPDQKSPTRNSPAKQTRSDQPSAKALRPPVVPPQQPGQERTRGRKPPRAKPSQQAAPLETAAATTKPPVAKGSPGPHSALERVAGEAQAKIYTAELVEEPQAAPAEGSPFAEPAAKKRYFVAVAAVGIGSVVLLMAASWFFTSGDSDLVVIDPEIEVQLTAISEKLPGKLAAYESAVSKTETIHRDRISVILASMQYGSVAEFEEQLARATADTLLRMGTLTKLHAQVEESLLESEPWVLRAQSHAGEAHAGEVELQRLVEQIDTAREQWQAMPTPASLRVHYNDHIPAPAETELSMLRSFQRAASNLHWELSEAELARAATYLRQGNSRLFYLAIATIAQADEVPEALPESLARIQWDPGTSRSAHAYTGPRFLRVQWDQYSSQQRANLCRWLLQTEHANATELATACLLAEPELLDKFKVTFLLAQLEANPALWQPLQAPLLERVTDSQQALRVLTMLCNAQDKNALQAIELSCSEGALSKVRGTVIEQLIAAQWGEAYGLVGKLLQQRPTPGLTKLSITQLNQVWTAAPATGLLLAQHSIVHGNANQCEWAAGVYLAETDYTQAQFQQAVKAATPRARTAVLNMLLSDKADKSLTTAAWILSAGGELETTTIAYKSACAEALARQTIARPLHKLLWSADGAARQWLIKQKYGIDIGEELAWAQQRRAAHVADIAALDKLIIGEKPVGTSHVEIYTNKIVDNSTIGDLTDWTDHVRRLEQLQMIAVELAAHMKGTNDPEALLRTVEELQAHDRAYRVLVDEARSYFKRRPEIRSRPQANLFGTRRSTVTFAVYRIPRADYVKINKNKKRFEALITQQRK